MASRSTSTPLLRALRSAPSGSAVGSAGGPSHSSRSLSTTLPTSKRVKPVIPEPEKPFDWTPTPGAAVNPFLPPRETVDSTASTPMSSVSPLFPLAIMPRGTQSGGKLDIRAQQHYLDNAPPTPQALSAIVRRLNLDDTDETSALLLKAITHPSYKKLDVSHPDRLNMSKEEAEAAAVPVSADEHNDQLAEVGRSILGFVLSEYYGKKFPNLPTKALKLLMTALTNPEAMTAVGAEIGIGKKGVPVRYERTLETVYVAVTAQARTVKMTTKELRQKGRKGGAQYEMEQQEVQSKYNAVAITSAVRAVIGLIYQEKGFDAAAAFINGHFISRQVDVPSILRFEHPFRILESTVIRYGLTHPVGRLLKESGRLSQSPYYVVGYFSDDIKLGEGFGSSMVMASHRAATNALQTLYLATPPSLQPVLSIPTLPNFPLTDSPLYELSTRYRHLAPAIGESEAIYSSSDRAGSHGWTDPKSLSLKGEVLPSGIDRLKKWEREEKQLGKKVPLKSDAWRDVERRERSDRRTREEKVRDGVEKGKEAMRRRKEEEEGRVLELWKEEVKREGGERV